MFRTAELGQSVEKQEFNKREPILRQRLISAQVRLRAAGVPAIVLFGGVDGAGKGETANLLNSWMDPRWIVTRAFGEPSDEERERPPFWRFWRDMPPKGSIGVFLSAWYTLPLLGRAYRRISSDEFDAELMHITQFERMLARDGMLIHKFWMHLGKDAQERRLHELEADPLNSWRVTKADWKNWRRYEKFIEAAERIVMHTSKGFAPWTIVEGEDHNYRSLKVAGVLLEDLERRVASEESASVPTPAVAPVLDGVAEGRDAVDVWPLPVRTVLDALDMSLALPKRTYREELQMLQARLHELHHRAWEERLSAILVFEGWDAGGKGGAIRHVTAALDARNYQVIQIQAPNDEERRYHYLWRFWRHMPRAGRVTVFDRSWYGRVLVERVEGFCSEREWRRAYGEINTFEQSLIDNGTVLLKFWMHVTYEEQERRFTARQETPHKRWKLTDEDWRNRERWHDYDVAVNEMIEHTSTKVAPWVLVEGNNKRYARIKVLREVCDAIEKALEKRAENGKAED